MTARNQLHPQAALRGSPTGPGVPDTPLLRVIVTGWRDMDDPGPVRTGLTRAWRDAGGPIVVVHGACRARRLGGGLWAWATMTGADRHADDWAVEHTFAGIQVERHPADWRDGRRAGPTRNGHMIALGAWRLLAFPNPDGPSYGTRDCIRQAEAAGLDVRYPTQHRDHDIHGPTLQVTPPRREEIR